ncbi:glycosyltransferase [Pelagibacteraceae bacterium]|jgi:UDP-N-acetylmuramyl pentapeptide phosphotransferase/UDP-N-acetylglucosamine-1-phosphate transferase|nr:glycosyltransferase [Pelagibacteraceae bacterium]|tara:strand:+ start:939 stop:2000 length:1062 start_codon:yes stop_codon:yes gene_type:complete
MGTESIEASFLSIFALISFFIFLLISKYSHRIRGGALLDKDFSKPQAFHDIPVTRSGGLAAIISLSIFFYIYYLLYAEVLYNYILISYSLFLVGFLDDLRINIKPFKRLMLMVFLLFVIIYFLPIKIFNIDIPFLTSFMSSHMFSSIFILLCFLFVINGANLIDGFNGLLTINLIIINIILTYININNQNLEFSILLISQIIILLSFLLFNFPNAKIFLGDSGAYIMGALTGLNTIITNNLNPKISSFFFCTLLFYLFFEVFFSFFRKLIQKKSPIYPDDKHLHMLSFYKISRVYGKSKSNYLNSIIINFLYLVLITPGLYLLNDTQLSRYWFFILLFIYLIIYSRLYRLTKN